MSENTYMAYDFGDSIHVLELDEFGAAVGDATVIALTAGRDERLLACGWRVRGPWSMQGEVLGAVVEPI